jgi:prepilin-type N-terminal cleavage/methylation domain-containing protein/prepilin-type processing-associated H-X9-DG protein
MTQSTRVASIRRDAFTLLELLVVIGIIAVLIAILLPVLGKARRAAQTTACMANLRSIGQAMMLYTTENRGWLPGSGWTTGAMFWNFLNTPPTRAVSKPAFSVSYSPHISESNDWIAPLSPFAGYEDDPAITGNDDVQRYQRYRELAFTTCPAYQSMPVPASSKSDADAGPGPGLGYCTSLAFLDRAWETYSATDKTELNGNLVIPAATSNRGIITLPFTYGPNLLKIGDPSHKVFASDGARTIIPTASDHINVVNPPVYVISANPGLTNWDNTSFADYGAFGGWSHSAYRTAVPGNATHPPTQDVRIWAYRHGTIRPFQPAGSYRMNAVFFDGHCETLDDVQAANPALWIPKGTVIYPNAGCSGSAVAGTKTVWSDVQSLYCPGVSSASGQWVSP